jgi:hypothetical protein
LQVLTAQSLSAQMTSLGRARSGLHSKRFEEVDIRTSKSLLCGPGYNAEQTGETLSKGREESSITGGSGDKEITQTWSRLHTSHKWPRSSFFSSENQKWPSKRERGGREKEKMEGCIQEFPR